MTTLPLDEVKISELIRQCHHLNVFPMDLKFQRTGNGHHPIYDILDKLLDEGVEYLKIMSDEEIWALVDALPPQLTGSFRSKPRGPFSDVVLQGLARNYIIMQVYNRYWPIREVVSGHFANSEVFKIYPELQKVTDDDGLLYLDDRFRLSDSGIEYKDHVLQYHQFLRRRYTSQPNFDFLGTFINYYSESNGINEFRIAIDHRRVMPKEFFQRIVELDTWYGPRFDRSKLDDPSATGVTVVKLQISGPMKRLFFSGLERTEFFWSYRDGIKTFQAEEVSEESNIHDAYYLNRYVHSERDVAHQILRHFDGAVKIYLKDAYAERLAKIMPDQPKSHWKPKLFRIDARKDEAGSYIGGINIDNWIELTSMFFKGNVMVIEYFDPELYATQFKDHEGDDDEES